MKALALALAVVAIVSTQTMDIVCIGTATANLKWYENVGKR